MVMVVLGAQVQHLQFLVLLLPMRVAVAAVGKVLVGQAALVGVALVAVQTQLVLLELQILVVVVVAVLVKAQHTLVVMAAQV
jgi:hypothetical protein